MDAPNIPSLAQLLSCTAPIPTNPQGNRTAYNPIKVMENRLRNADKPCCRCGFPKRYISPSGKTASAMCEKCFKADSAAHRAKRKLSI